MKSFMTLTWLRRVVQLFSFVVLVYGSLFLTTFYSEDKLTQALPSLACAYDKEGGDYCTLIPLQHHLVAEDVRQTELGIDSSYEAGGCQQNKGKCSKIHILSR